MCSVDGDWHRVVTRNRYVKPMRTQDYRTGVSGMDDFGQTALEFDYEPVW